MLLAMIVALAGMAQAAPAAKPSDPMISKDAAWAKALKAANDANFDDCFINKVNAKCEAFVAGIENARRLAKGHAAVEHVLLPNLYEVRMRTVYTQLAAGKLDAALATASAGLKAADAHYDNGKHFHAMTESLALRVAYGKALIEARKDKEAEAQYAAADQIAQAIYSNALSAKETPKFDSPAYKVWRDAMRYGADANLDWADLQLEQDGDKESPAISAAVADKIGRALLYLELAERRDLIWVDTQSLRTDKIASLAKVRAGLLADLGRYRDARLQLGWADSLIAPHAVGEDYFAKRVQSWRADLKSTNAYICKRGGSKVAMEKGMLAC